MKRAAPEGASLPRVRLLLHTTDGVVNYMTPSLLRKYVPPSDDLWIGIAVRDCCVVPQYLPKKGEAKKPKKESDGTSSKPNGYTFLSKGVDSFLLPYNRVTVPSFDVLQDATDFDSRNEKTGVSSTDRHVLVWTPHGRHKLTSSLHVQASQDLKSHAAVPLYDMALETESAKRKKIALRRNASWLDEFVQQNTNVWAPLVLGMDEESMLAQIKHARQHNLGGIAFVGEKRGQAGLAESIKACLDTSTNLPATLALLSTRSTVELIDATRAGINMIGTELPAMWARSKRAFVVCLDASHATKRARLEEDEDELDADLDADGCIDMEDKRWARDIKPLLPGCPCMACSNSHSRAYIHHLVQAKELLAEILLFAHNLHHILALCRALSGDMDAIYESVKMQLFK
jgi:tRNA-guanine family transglycosylase